MTSRPNPSWLFLCLLACSEETPDKISDGPGPPRKVLVVGWDGAKPDSVQLASTPNLERVASWGGISYEASTQLSHATISAPGWASVMTGVEPEKHGVTFNGFYDNRDTSWLTFVQRAQDAGLRTGVAAVWPEVALDIVEEGAADEASVDGEDEVADWMAGHIEADTFDVHFVHQDAPDHAGHDTGYYPDNPDYISAIEASDLRLGRMLDAIEARTDEEWLVAVTTDHGASGGGHGGMDADNQTIWTAYGTPGETRDWGLANPSHLDVHPTVLDFLGIPVDTRGVDGVSQLP
jgi:arylsulfatase A-like enzyme